MDLIGDILLATKRGLIALTDSAIRGRIGRVTGTRDKTFVDVVDPTGTIQVVIQAHIDELKRSPSPAVGELWEFGGGIDSTSYKTRSGSHSSEVTPVITLVARHAERLDVGGPPMHERAAARDEATPFMRAAVLARLRQAASLALNKHGYLEIEPRLVGLSTPITGLEPLHVSYVGFGAPAHLIPSPAAQLRHMLLVSDIDAVCAISRIFSTTFRDEKTSYEALTAMALRVRPSVEASEVRPFDLERLVGEISSERWFQDARSDELFRSQPTLIETQVSGPPKPIISEVDGLTLESYSTLAIAASAEPGDLRSFHRLIGPPRTVLAERAVTGWFGASLLELTTIHLERFAAFVP